MAIRLWCPKGHTRHARYRTKLQLAQTMLLELLPLHLPFAYLVFDGWYTAGGFTKWLTRQDIVWVGEGRCNANEMHPSVRLPFWRAGDIIYSGREK